MRPKAVRVLLHSNCTRLCHMQFISLQAVIPNSIHIPGCSQDGQSTFPRYPQTPRCIVGHRPPNYDSGSTLHFLIASYIFFSALGFRACSSTIVKHLIITSCERIKGINVYNYPIKPHSCDIIHNGHIKCPVSIHHTRYSNSSYVYYVPTTKNRIITKLKTNSHHGESFRETSFFSTSCSKGYSLESVFTELQATVLDRTETCVSIEVQFPVAMTVSMDQSHSSIGGHLLTSLVTY